MLKKKLKIRHLKELSYILFSTDTISKHNMQMYTIWKPLTRK